MEQIDLFYSLCFINQCGLKKGSLLVGHSSFRIRQRRRLQKVFLKVVLQRA